MKDRVVRAGLAASCVVGLAGGVALAGPAAAAVASPRMFQVTAGPATYLDLAGVCADPATHVVAQFLKFQTWNAVTVVASSADDISTSSGSQFIVVSGAGEHDISTGAGKDYVCGSPGDDEISLGAGADEAVGGAGDDEIFGGAGKDLLAGGADDDRLFGGAASDLLEGGAGTNECDGGSGTDTEICP